MNRRMISFVVVFSVAFMTQILSAQGHGPMFEISIGTHTEGWPTACYNSNTDEYLVVWEDYRNGASDIYGQIVNGDGTLNGSGFAICASDGHQFWPRLDFDPQHGQYLVVFEDWRGSSGDIRGIIIAGDGTPVDAPTSDEDHSFGICTNDGDIYTCSVAYDLERMQYLVVWGDSRNDPTGSSFIGVDVFGQIVGFDGTLLPPPSPADPTTNFPLADDVDVVESVADVTFSAATREWLVVYGTDTGYVYCQRVNGFGELVDPAGAVVAEPDLDTSAIRVSKQFQNGPDCLQTRVKANNEFSDTIEGWIECEVVWKGTDPDLEDNDVWGQRIGFVGEGSTWVAEYVDINGDITSEVSNHPISIQDGWCGVPEVDFSYADNEFLVSWGDPRSQAINDVDLYYQRLWVDADQTYDMIWLDDDRVNTVTETENIPVFTTENYEGSLLGIAHSTERNEFLVAFTYEDPLLGRESDIMGVIASGSPPVSIDDAASIPVAFDVQATSPNPFSSETTVRFRMPTDERVSVVVYDVTGREVARLLDDICSAGHHELTWSGRDDAGNDAAPGTYYYAIRSGALVSTQKMVLIR